MSTLGPTATSSTSWDGTVGDRLSLSLPPGASVRHKIGTLLGGEMVSVNDIGYVTRPNGEVVVMAVFIKDSPTRSRMRPATR